MKNKQTSVEWLEDKINTYDFNQGMAQMRKYIAHAKAMNKEQIMDAYIDSYGNITEPEDYYNDTYGKQDN